MTNDDIRKYVDSIRKKKNVAVKIKGGKSGQPKALSYRFSGISYTPYMEADFGERVDIYEFEKTFSKNDLPEQISKWILFSMRAKNCSGQFFLVVADDSKLKFEEIINDKQIEVVLLTV